jgi:hypothetical protein
VRQAQVQQPRTALGLGHFQRMLQHHYFNLVLRWRNPLADAGALRAQADGAA